MEKLGKKIIYMLERKREKKKGSKTRNRIIDV